MKSRLFASLLLSLSLGAAAKAQIIVHTPNDAKLAGVAVTILSNAVASDGVVGAKTIAFGVDYSFGNVEGIFDDPPLAFGGVAAGGKMDLLAGVDARIVTLNSLSQGLTDFVSVTAGN